MSCTEMAKTQQDYVKRTVKTQENAIPTKSTRTSTCYKFPTGLAYGYVCEVLIIGVPLEPVPTAKP